MKYVNTNGDQNHKDTQQPNFFVQNVHCINKIKDLKNDKKEKKKKWII